MPDQNYSQTNDAGESSLHAPGPSLRNIEKIPVARARLRKRLRARPLRPPSRRSVLTVCAAFSALALLIWIYNALDLGRALNQDWLGAHLRVLGVWGYPLFVLLAAIVTSIAGPRQLVSFAGGYVYGAALGVLLSLTGALIGCAINFFAARLFAGKLPFTASFNSWGGWLVLPLVGAALTLAYRRRALRLDARQLTIASTLYTRRVPLSSMHLDRARVVNFAENPDFKPGMKSNGFQFPGFRSGHFHMKDGGKGFCLITDDSRVLVIPLRDGNSLLISPQQPRVLLDELKRLADGSRQA